MLDDAGNVDEKLPKRPAFATGALDLSVPPLARTLTVAVTPRDKALDPGGKTTVDVALKDAAGKPVEGGEVAVVVVDEAVLALTGYQTARSDRRLLRRRSPDASDFHLRSNLVLANLASRNPASRWRNRRCRRKPAATWAAAERRPWPRPRQRLLRRPLPAPQAPGAAMDGRCQARQPPIALRTDFNALAIFAPTVPTDAEGLAQVEVKLPDNLTRYRVMVVAVDAGGKQFGAGESTLTARLPLMVRPRRRAS